MKWLIGLVTTGIVVVAAFIVLAVASRSGVVPVAHYPTSLLEADRVMTQEMATQVHMGEDGMLGRSADQNYVRALEEYIRQFDRMLGRVP